MPNCYVQVYILQDNIICIRLSLIKYRFGACTMTQLVKELAAEPIYLRVIFRTHAEE